MYPHGRQVSGFICENCYVQCDWCGELCREGDSTMIGCDDICPRCLDVSCFMCARCNNWTHEDDCVMVGETRYDSNSWCAICADARSSWCESCDVHHPDGFSPCIGSDLINNYSYKPMPVFYKAPNDIDADRNLYMGFELEVECRNADIDTAAETVIDSFGDLVYLKEDGSLSHGFEIVTHPMTLAYAKSLSMDALGELIRQGVRSWNTDTCGLHVHVSRATFTNVAHQYAFTLLLMRNRALSYVVAGREGNHYARFDKSLRPAIAKWLKTKGDHSRGYPPERYAAVNTGNYATIEVRMFRGSLKRDRVLAALEYVHAAVEYSRSAPRAANDAATEYLSAPAFIQWIRNNRHHYGELCHYINKSFLGFDKVEDNHNRAVPNDYRTNEQEV
jgi:hypothetical protein